MFTGGDSVLDLPLMQVTAKDALTLGNACEGVQIFGGVGSGKTSGSGRAFAHEFLKLGMGGLVLCAKVDEAAQWQAYARQTGRESDLVLFDPDNPYRFNFLSYEASREGKGAGQTRNIVDIFMAVMGGADFESNTSNSYFPKAAKRMLGNAIELCKLATAPITLDEIQDIIATAPRKSEGIFDDSVDYKYTKAASRNHKCVEMLRMIESYAFEHLSPAEQRAFRQIENYWTVEFPNTGADTIGSVVSTFTAISDGLQRGELHELFATDSETPEHNITPEDSFAGKIIVVNLPYLEWGEVGLTAQTIFKYMWQKAVQRRPIDKATMPAFLWVDEAHLFLTEEDNEYLSTARSARACTVYLTQTYNSYKAKLGGKGEVKALNLMDLFQTKIFHQNSSTETNQFAADQIGKKPLERFSGSVDERMGGEADMNAFGNSLSFRIENDYPIQPSEFTTLRKGGNQFGKLVDAVIYQGGRIWNESGENYAIITFRQQDNG